MFRVCRMALLRTSARGERRRRGRGERLAAHVLRPLMLLNSGESDLGRRQALEQPFACAVQAEPNDGATASSSLMGVHTHLITSRAAMPLLLRTAGEHGSRGLVVEMTEGTSQ